MHWLGAQDSLGGNSKTTMIANISPSSWYAAIICFLSQSSCSTVATLGDICFWVLPKSSFAIWKHAWVMNSTQMKGIIKFSLHCSCALETLSTLKFAQRAKKIKNNVRV
jgi:hypothetical protein